MIYQRVYSDAFVILVHILQLWVVALVSALRLIMQLCKHVNFYVIGHVCGIFAFNIFKGMCLIKFVFFYSFSLTSLLL